MIDNEIYLKIKKHYLYNEYSIKKICSLCVIISFISYVTMYFIYVNNISDMDLDSIVKFSYIYSIATFIIPVMLIIFVFSKPEKILINKYQEEIIVYCKENMPQEHELLNNMLNYIREMKNLGNKVINLENNSKYKSLLEKVMNHELELKKKDYESKINDLKIWLETKIIEHNVSGYDVDKHIADYFDNNKLKIIFLKENNYQKYKSIINNNRYLYNKLYETDIEKAIYKFKEEFIKNEI